MKRLGILTLLFALTILPTMAQKEIRYGVQAGAGISRFINSKLHNNVSYSAGAKMDVRFTEQPVYMSTGLFLTRKGGKSNKDIGNFTVESYYLELPIRVRFEQLLNDEFTFFQEVGPYLAYGLFGDTTSDQYTTTIIENGTPKEIVVPSQSYSTFSSQGIKRFDLGVGFKLGVICYEHFEVSVSIDWGLLKPQRKANGKNQNISFNIGYLF